MKTVTERFYSRLRERNSCIEWCGSKDKKGYGRISISCYPVLTHRLAWELVHGPIPKGLSVLHHCDNPPCCNPAHLFLGTIADNNRDMAMKGRNWKQRQPKKTHCLRGHEMTPDNQEGRGCKACRRAHLRRYRDENRDAVRADERARYHADIERSRERGRLKQRARNARLRGMQGAP